jgi:hypothetical protein
MRIDSSGNVGIGFTSLTSKLTVNTNQSSGVADLLTLRDGSAGTTFNMQTYADPSFGTANRFDFSGAYLAFRRSGTEAMRIDSSGRVIIASIPSFLASTSSSTNTTVNTNNKFPFGSTKYNTGSHYSTANSRFTCPVSGLYWFYVSLHADTDADDCRPSIRVNGSDYTITTDALQAFARTPSASTLQLNMSVALDLSANDYVEVWARAGGGSTTYYTGHSWFGGYLIG